MIDRVLGGSTKRAGCAICSGDCRLAVHAHEPLGGGEEDHRVVTAPAVRVLVLERFAVPEPPSRRERLFDLRVRIEHALAAEKADGLQKVTARVDRRIDVEIVLPPRQEVVRSVSGSGVHDACSGVERDIVGEHADRIALVERVTEPNAFEQLACHPGDRSLEVSADDCGNSRCKTFGHDHRATVHVISRVVELRMKRQRQVRRNRPRRRRPDQCRHLAARERGNALRQFTSAHRIERKLHVDRRRRMVCVLDLGFRERGAAVNAPVDRLLAFVDQRTLDEFSECARDVRLVPRIHRDVVMVPVAEDHQPLEFGSHHVDVPPRVLATCAADIGDRHVALLRPELAIDFQLDRQTVAVVSRLVRNVAARHRP